VQRLQLLRGDLADVVQKTAASRRRYIVGGLFALVVVHAIAYGVVALYRNSDEAHKEWKHAVYEAVRTSNLTVLERQIPDRVPADLFLDDEGRTPLMFAKDGAIAQALIARGANVNATDRGGETPLMYAARHDHLEVLQALINAGADLERTRRVDGRTALEQAIWTGHERCADALRAAGARE
jgi:hypothetical protein